MKNSNRMSNETTFSATIDIMTTFGFKNYLFNGHQLICLKFPMCQVHRMWSLFTCVAVVAIFCRHNIVAERTDVIFKTSTNKNCRGYLHEISTPTTKKYQRLAGMEITRRA